MSVPQIATRVMFKCGPFHKLLDLGRCSSSFDVRWRVRIAFNLDPCDLTRINIYPESSSTPLPDTLLCAELKSASGESTFEVKEFNDIFIKYGERTKPIMLGNSYYYNDLVIQLQSVFWLPNVSSNYYHFFTPDNTPIRDSTPIPDMSVPGTPGWSSEAPVILKMSHSVDFSYEGTTRRVSTIEYLTDENGLTTNPQVWLSSLHLSILFNRTFNLQVNENCINYYSADGQLISPDDGVSVLEHPMITIKVVGINILLRSGRYCEFEGYDYFEGKTISCDDDIPNGGLYAVNANGYTTGLPIMHCEHFVEGGKYAEDY